MWAFGGSDQPDRGKEMLTFALGAAGGLALGLIVARARGETVELRSGGGLRQRARAAVRRFGPARLRRQPIEQGELMELEDAVIDALLDDEILRERGIDVGALSVGIIELSGTLHAEDEIERAVGVASRVPGIKTVVNRLDFETTSRGADLRRRVDEDDDLMATEWGWSGGHSGMGRSRQGRQTEPDRTDDSQHIRERAIDFTDREQWMEEGLAAKNPKTTVRSEGERSDNRTRYRESELDNQDPHGKHASNTLDAPPQELHTDTRVGEGLEPGTELKLEGTDMPEKPHGKRGSAADKER
jgi:hypothetical protein